MSRQWFIADHEVAPEPGDLTDSADGQGAASYPMLSLTHVADQLDVSLSSVRRRIAEGALRVHRFGRAVRVSQADLAAFLAASRGEKQ